MSSRSLCVKCDNTISSSFIFTCGVPQGSVLGPPLFVMHTTPFSTLISSLSYSLSLNHHVYADDTQLFLLSPAQGLLICKNALQQISSWMTANLLTLNSSNKKGIPSHWIPKATFQYTYRSSLNISHSARNLGFVFGEYLNFTDQISAVSKSC